MLNLYNALVESGVPEKQSAHFVADFVFKTGRQEELTLDVILQLDQPPPVFPKPIPAYQDGREHSKARIIAHILLNRAYRLNHPMDILVDWLNESMLKVFNSVKKEPSYPSIQALQVILSSLRHDKFKGLPTIETEGPLERTREGIKIWLIRIHPRNEAVDRAMGYLLPDWVWFKLKDHK